MTLATTLLNPLTGRTGFTHLGGRAQVRPDGAGPAGQADGAVPARPARGSQAAAPAPLPAWGDPQAYALQLEALLGGCRRQARLAAVLLVEVLPADADSAAALMQAIGQRLRSRVRATDQVAQLGAEAFSVLLLDAGERSSHGVRERLDGLLRAPYRVGTGLAQPLLRIGRAVHGLDGHHASELLRAATLGPR